MTNNNGYIYYVDWYGKHSKALFYTIEEAMEYINRKMSLGFVSYNGNTYGNEIINIGSISIEEDSKRTCLITIFRSMRDGNIINDIEHTKDSLV